VGIYLFGEQHSWIRTELQAPLGKRRLEPSEKLHVDD